MELKREKVIQAARRLCRAFRPGTPRVEEHRATQALREAVRAFEEESPSYTRVSER